MKEDLEKSQKMIYKILMQKTGQTLTKIKAACARDLPMDAREALLFGLIDEIW